MATDRLAGQGIVVTRPREQAENFARLIRSAGGRPLCFPSVEIAGPPDPVALRAVLQRLGQFDLAVFVSPTAVERAFTLMDRLPATLRAAAVGPGTRRALEHHGVRDVISPADGADSESLLGEPQFASLEGRRILIVRGAGGREVLGEALVQRGATIEYAQCYRRERPQIDLAPLLDEWSRGAVHAVTVFSRGALANLRSMLGDPAHPLVRRTPCFASHARIAEEALRLGASTVRVAGPGDDEMMAGLVAYFNEAG